MKRIELSGGSKEKEAKDRRRAVQSSCHAPKRILDGPLSSSRCPSARSCFSFWPAPHAHAGPFTLSLRPSPSMDRPDESRCQHALGRTWPS
ncbi:Hypothetical protein NTJ_16153 [Nesidiocoris tenuis]|uniref:Uncharacterized protein n=1 Tax=Nesidiocoris tenuis TaxID=355587 RepID=A0ABN7BHM8_9HEMI|nr:Hypothetical protein NTJ_16153 [Nesidiocoris tenuis]